MTAITKHFTLEELTQSQTAQRKGLDNTPPPEALAELRWTAVGLESVRRLLGDKPLTITSGYRSAAVNAAVGGTKGSQHLLGQAADFICPAYGPPADIIRAIVASGCIDFDQLIEEYGPTGWVHVSFVKDHPRSQVLKIDAAGTRPFFQRA